MPIWQLCANLLIPNCLRSNLSYSPLAALELYVKKCISYYSYIKPQHRRISSVLLRVVYRTIPTSNHNWKNGASFLLLLYIVLFLHQTTTIILKTILNGLLYIVLFLHQTTTLPLITSLLSCCISYYSYIKPQRSSTKDNPMHSCISYYSYIKPQHQEVVPEGNNCCISYYSYIKPQLPALPYGMLPVVYRTIPTSNHNMQVLCVMFHLLYIVLFLHQTTTARSVGSTCVRCISYYSYIKPQPVWAKPSALIVVYRTIPTSNHNMSPPLCKHMSLYIVLFLHQTTTCV